MDRIPEKDWKKLRSIEEDLLDNACGVALANIKTLIDKRQGGNYKTFKNLWGAIKDEDKKIGHMFDDMKRSEAMLRIVFMFKYNIINEDLLGEFGDETQSFVKKMIKLS